MNKTLFYAIFFILVIPGSKAGDIIKIMPIGNSITGGNHYQAPPLEERTGYRKALYEMLIESGYNVDFVGSQKEGIRPEEDTNWYDWNCEAYPGKKIDFIANKVKDQLPLYKPDVLLVHVGTNGHDWEPKPGQVMDMLDMFNEFSIDSNHSMTVFLCKIINLCEGPDSLIYGEDTLTTQFNTVVADSVAARSGDKIKIIMVDMEHGAGLIYTDSLPDPTANPPFEGGDMWGSSYPEYDGTDFDKYHPNDKGNTKMAVKFYEELIKELEPPDSIKNNMVEGIEIIATSDSTIKVRWSANFVDEDGYIVERAEIGGTFTVVDTADANSLYLLDTIANATKEYIYRVKAFNADGESLNSEEITYTPSYNNLTVSVEGQGSAEPGNSQYLAGTNTVVFVTGIPEEGWEFDIWTGDISSWRYSNPAKVIMDSDKSITCTFKEIISHVPLETESLHRFYPNPVSDYLTIELPKDFSRQTEIQVFDNTGRKVFKKKVQGPRLIVNMDNFLPGIYFIKVTGNFEDLIIKRISKQ